ncbi:HEAT repeat domain-containing protein [Paenibacillus sp. S-38]|uniref:HEAT repeat domain-containing protein n=1 Tax=Paenibacillus sp. S-38 TaxID=3416710 RepID=UPI003CF5BA0D
MSQYGDIGTMGRQYLQAESYGAAAFCFYRALLDDKNNNNAWNGIILSLSLMRKEGDSQTMLARFALNPQLNFDRDMITFAMMLFQHNPLAMSQWLRGIIQMNGISETDQANLGELAADLERAYAGLVAEHGEETLKEQGMVELKDYALRRIELDWLLEESIDNIFGHLGQWLEDPEMVLPAVRLLCMLPDPRSEKMLRRVCRNDAVDAKVRTHGLLALRWLGVRGNAKLQKFGESFVINLDEPDPELTVSVPTAFRPALDRIKLWVAKEQGLVSTETYEQHASTDEVQLPEEVAAKLNEADVPTVLQEVSHMLIRAAYDRVYPYVPHVEATRNWAAALLRLMREYSVGMGQGWPYGDPEDNEDVERHRQWLLTGSPDFYEVLQARGAQQQQA